ncbi:hypothetical protein RZS08_27100, partial [Arthrospira platensis SPKY1]|nr:hypothetical protein [Arthrospira platensis SPKY1]
MVAVNGCGAGPVACLPVVLDDLPGAPTIDGPDEVCPGDITTYTATPGSGQTTSYTWTAPAGATIINGQGTASIEVDWGNSAGGDICVVPSNDCGDGPEVCFTVLAGELPETPVIAGLATVCAGDTV